jgi:nucleotide-binding universal stress UspA family protein
MSYDRILVPLDGSQLAEYIVPHVENMARAFNSEVMLLHVIEAEEPDPALLTPSQKTARANITKYLERVSGVLAKKRVAVKWQVSVGKPVAEIIRHADEGGAELVMMSTHGQGATPRDGMGSVAMAVVSAGKVPVMVVRPPDIIASR